jgi:transcriptional regulator with XRE-family HTH domain
MREARGLSIEEVAKATKISANYIRALEEGDYESLPADIYVRGFIKSYGQLLNADLEELNARYETARPKPKARRIFSGKPKEDLPYESPIPKSAIGKKRVLPRRIKLNRGSIIVIVLVLVGLIVILRTVLNKKGPSGPPITSITEVASADSGASNGNKLVSPLTTEDLTQEIRLKLGEINPAWALGRADSLTLSIYARQKSWILVETDYKRAFKGDIDRGQTMVFVAKNSFFLTMGNPSVMHLMINGFDMTEWPERVYPMDLDITRANVLQLLEGAEQLSLPRPPRPGIIGAPPSESDSVLTPPPLRTRGITVGAGELRNNETPPPESPR